MYAYVWLCPVRVRVDAVCQCCNRGRYTCVCVFVHGKRSPRPDLSGSGDNSVDSGKRGTSTSALPALSNAKQAVCDQWWGGHRCIKIKVHALWGIEVGSLAIRAQRHSVQTISTRPSNTRRGLPVARCVKFGSSPASCWRFSTLSNHRKSLGHSTVQGKCIRRNQNNWPTHIGQELELQVALFRIHCKNCKVIHTLECPSKQLSSGVKLELNRLFVWCFCDVLKWFRKIKAKLSNKR